VSFIIKNFIGTTNQNGKDIKEQEEHGKRVISILSARSGEHCALKLDVHNLTREAFHSLTLARKERERKT
jgi:hypothetical protein